MKNSTTYSLFWLLLFFECNTPPNMPITPIKNHKDSIDTKPKPAPITTSPAGYSESTDPKQPEGYVLKDKNGKIIKFIKTDDLYKKNPYMDTNFGSVRPKNITDYRSFNVKNISIEQIKTGLSKSLKIIPSNAILKKAGTIIVSTSTTNLNIENPSYLIIIYKIIMYGKNTSIEDWSESTIHIYDKRGKICSKITDNRNIEDVFLSSDGKYLLTNHILGRTNDCWSDVTLTTLVYDVQNGNHIGSIGKSVIDLNENVSYQSGKFLAFGVAYKKIEATEETSLMKIIIDPINKRYYQKPYARPNNISRSDEPALRSKTSQNEDGEDIGTYRAFRL
jgi:hypothetical protein